MERLSYGAEPAAAAVAKMPAHARAVTAYKAREAELMAMVEPTQTGALEVKPHKRAEIASRLSGVGAMDPALADQMESIAVRRIEYLAAKLPRRPDALAGTFGPDRWRPSDMEIASFARTAAAVEDPHSVLERVLDASITPEDADALRSVYPELFNEQRASIIERIPELRESLSYQRRLALSIFFDAPVDPSMDPRVVAVLQSHFASDIPGGGAPPESQPQFGSVQKTADTTPTQAQQRQSQEGSQ